jgi:hypothetical protein
LPRFAVPQKIVVSETPIHGERFKKIRRDSGSESTPKPGA